MALVLKTLQHSSVIDKLFEQTEILTKEQNINPDLASVLATELIWGKRCLEGESKPVLTVLKYQEKFLQTLSADGLDVEDPNESSSYFALSIYLFSKFALGESVFELVVPSNI